MLNRRALKAYREHWLEGLRGAEDNTETGTKEAKGASPKGIHPLMKVYREVQARLKFEGDDDGRSETDMENAKDSSMEGIPHQARPVSEGDNGEGSGT